MNTDSKLKRYVVLLNKTPFILFVESENSLIRDHELQPVLKKLNLSILDPVKVIPVSMSHNLIDIVTDINRLADPLAFNIINKLADVMPDKYYLTSPVWQKAIKWQNVDDKPTTVNQYTITIDRWTHKLSIVQGVAEAPGYDGVVNLSNINNRVEFPKGLLKECVIDIHNIMVTMAMNRDVDTITKSNYMSVMQTGHEKFNWVNLVKIEKDLKATLISAGITVEK